MRIFQILAVAVLGVSFTLLIRAYRPEMALLTGIVTGLILFFSVLSELSGVIDALQAAARRYGIDADILGVLMKIVGIAYLAQIGSRICADAGAGAVADRVEICGRILIVAAALPALLSVLSASAALLQAASP